MKPSGNVKVWRKNARTPGRHARPGQPDYYMRQLDVMAQRTARLAALASADTDALLVRSAFLREVQEVAR